MNALIVGQRYGTRTEPWDEGVQFNWRSGGCELMILFNEPTTAEIAAGESGAIQYALFLADEQIIFLYRFWLGDHAELGPWSDAPYSFWRLDADEQTLPNLGAPGHALLSVLLLDARDGTIMAMRAHTLSEQFTDTLFRAIHAQAGSHQPWDAAAYDRHLDSIRALNTTEMLAKRAVVSCWGGD